MLIKQDNILDSVLINMNESVLSKGRQTRVNGTETEGRSRH